MKKIIYLCDRCGREMDTPNRIHVENEGKPIKNIEAALHEKDYCLFCLGEMLEFLEGPVVKELKSTPERLAELKEALKKPVNTAIEPAPIWEKQNCDLSEKPAPTLEEYTQKVTEKAAEKAEKEEKKAKGWPKGKPRKEKNAEALPELPPLKGHTVDKIAKLYKNNVPLDEIAKIIGISMDEVENIIDCYIPAG